VLISKNTSTCTHDVVSTDRLPPPRPQNGNTEHRLCRLDEIDDGASKEMTVPDSDSTLCLVRKGPTVYAYVNSCPHTGAPLNWDGDQFLTWDGDMIQCAIHGALFRITDGRCMWGPCLHQRLTAVPTIVREGVIMLANKE